MYGYLTIYAYLCQIKSRIIYERTRIHFHTSQPIKQKCNVGMKDDTCSHLLGYGK